MPPDERDLSALWDMLNAARAVSRFIAGLDYEAYLKNEEKQAAIKSGMLRMCEAANKVSKETKEKTAVKGWAPFIQWHLLDSKWYLEMKSQHVETPLADSSCFVLDDVKMTWLIATERVVQLIDAIEKVLAGVQPKKRNMPLDS
ncbi:MAG: hypothetical protein L6Q71_11820 [Planctomycetes bacterium]|nr:hypothetical protein [Planctomycetota bacterium]NUQ35470.1 hypothetical protein [Planctomycetaceae bacterium]